MGSESGTSEEAPESEAEAKPDVVSPAKRPDVKHPRHDDGQNKSSEDALYETLKARHPSAAFLLVAPEASLRRYRALEELSGRVASAELQNLAWLVRLKAEESAVAARSLRRRSTAIGTVAILVALFTMVFAVVAWFKLISFADKVDGKWVVPGNLWELVLATTASVLLLGAGATLLFKVAAEYLRRSREYACDGDFTRQIEVAIRLSLAAKNEDEKVRDSLHALARQLLERPGRGPDTEPDFSTIEPILKDLVTVYLRRR